MSDDFAPALVLLVKSTLVVLAAFAVVHTMRARRVRAVARHLVWLSAFAAMALLPIVTLALPPIEILVDYAQLGIATKDISTPGIHLRDYRTINLIWFVYVAGVCVMLLRLVAARMELGALWRDAEPFAASNADAVARLAGVPGAIEVRIADASIVPLCWGRRVLLPRHARDWPITRMQDVLLHEVCHVARRDSLTQIMAAFVRAAFWFSPAVWLALRELSVEQEFACDERVVESGADAVGYAQTLVEVAAILRTGAQGACVSTAVVQRSNLECRVTTILHPPQVRPADRTLMILGSASLLLFGTALALAHPIDAGRFLGSLRPLETPLDSNTADIDDTER